MQLGDGQWFRFLVHDRDTKFCHAFDDVFRSENITIIRTPIQAPNANAHAERWVRTLRADCLDRILILGRRHLELVLRVYHDPWRLASDSRTMRVGRCGLHGFGGDHAAGHGDSLCWTHGG